MARMNIKNKEMRPKEIEDVLANNVHMIENLSKELKKYTILVQFLKDIMVKLRMRDVIKI